MTVPSDVRQLAESWCEARTPIHVRDRARLEADVTGNEVTIYECTLGPDDDWLRVPSAQLRYDPRTRVWALYWIDGDSHWHIVQVAPTLDIDELLAEVDADPDCLFFG